MHGDVERPTIPGVRCEHLGRRGAAAWRCMGLHACMPHSGFSNASHTVVFLGQCRKKSRLARTCSGTALARTLARMISPSWCQSRTTQRNRCSSCQQCLHAAQYGMHTCPARQPQHPQHLSDLHICCLHSDICVFPGGGQGRRQDHQGQHTWGLCRPCCGQTLRSLATVLNKGWGNSSTCSRHSKSSRPRCRPRVRAVACRFLRGKVNVFRPNQNCDRVRSAVN